MSKNNCPRPRSWNADDRFAFATQRLRAATIPARRPDGPDADEWGGTDEWKFVALEQCPECGRVFDLTDPTDADEWAYGHDCEEGA